MELELSPEEQAAARSLQAALEAHEAALQAHGDAAATGTAEDQDALVAFTRARLDEEQERQLRLIRDLAGKHHMLDEFEKARAEDQKNAAEGRRETAGLAGRLNGLEIAVRAIAFTARDHPDYRPGWDLGRRTA